MTGHRDDDLTAALHNLRRSVQQQVPVPDSGVVRAAATRQLRVRRTAVGALAAAAVAAIAVGGAVVLQPGAAPPIPPAESPTERPTDGPSPSPSPSPDDPIVDVDWSAATIDVPPQERCPSGDVTFGSSGEPDPSGPPTAIGPVDGLPQITLYTADVAYGDLTGDGSAEAVLLVACSDSEEESWDGEGQALVVAREPDGSLTGLAWVGPRGAVYQDHWITGEALYLDAQPWHGETFDWAPGLALRIAWEGDGFSGYQPAPEYPPIMPVGAGEAPPVQLGAVAGGLGCPDGRVRFDDSATAQVDGATYDLTQPGVPASGPHLVDLHHIGQRQLLLAIECTRGGVTTQGLAVFELTEEGFFEGVSVLVPEGSAEIVMWSMAPAPDGSPHLVLDLFPRDQDVNVQRTYAWTGTEFEPVD